MAKTSKGLALSALLGSLIGTFSVMFSPKRQKLLDMLHDQSSSWAEKAKNMSHNARGALDGMRGWNTSRSEIATANFLKGSFMGLVVGAGAAMLLTPKTGSQIRKKITEHYSDAADKAQELIHVFNFGHKYHPVKKANHVVKRAATKTKKKVNRAISNSKKKLSTGVHKVAKAVTE